jgi:hypothetical protein
MSWGPNSYFREFGDELKEIFLEDRKIYAKYWIEKKKIREEKLYPSEKFIR